MKGSAPFHSFDQRVANSFVVILLSYYWLYTVWDSESSRAITIVQLRCSFSRCCPFNSRVLTNTTVVVVIMSIYGCIPLCIKVLGSLLHYGAGGDIYIYLSFTSGRSVWCKRAIAGSLPKATVENIEPLAHQPTLDRCRFDQSCILFVGVFLPIHKMNLASDSAHYAFATWFTRRICTRVITDIQIHARHSNFGYK